MRLFDVAVRDGFTPHPVADTLTALGREQLASSIEAATVVAVDNVVDLLTDRGHDPTGYYDQCVVPFARIAWIESLLGFIPSEGGGSHPYGFGTLLFTEDLGSASTDEDRGARRDGFLRGYGDKFTGDAEDVRAFAESGDVRWVVQSFHFVPDPARRHILGPYVHGLLQLGDDGRMLSRMTGGGVVRSLAMSRESDDEALMELIADHGKSEMDVVLTALAFAHCKNVALRDNEGRHTSRQARRLAERNGDPAPVTFKTLVIEPFGAGSRGTGTTRGGSGRTSLHICRGHFSTYTEDKPLFGKYAGQFWIPAHVRGTSDVGVVAKDYRVAGPAEAA